MSTTLQNSIWPNAGGTLGENKVAIPDGVTIKWPDGDALVGNFVYKDGKLVGLVDTKALVTNETKSTTIPYDCVIINLDNILEDTLTIIPGERCKSLTTVYGNVVEFFTPKLKELLGETKFELYFENDVKKLIIHTDRISDDMVASLEKLLSEVLPQTIETEKYNHNMEISWKDINKYAECKTIAEVKLVNPDYLNDLTSDSEWIYPLDSLTKSWGFSNAPNRWFVNKIKTRFLQLKTLEAWTFSYATATSIEVYCPEVTRITQFAGHNNKLRYLKIYAPKTKIIDDITWANPNVDLDFEAPNLENCGRFGGYGGYITHTSAIKFMNSLPTWTSGTHNLKAFTVHIDGDTDPEFQEALTSLESRGWYVDVQWGGTPTSTASTFNLGTLIYAKLGELERLDGTTEQILDWGHYVTNWEERGYEEFRSLESAYEYFGLEIPVEIMEE